MGRTAPFWLLAACCIGAPSTSASAEATKVETAGAIAPRHLEISVRRERLPNGLRILLNEDHSSPHVAICVTYDVGARNERSGEAGFAHLFEQMMFEGSRNIPRGDHFRLVSSRGGTAESVTSSERTSYVNMLPSSELALGLWLEADRMKTLALTQRKLDVRRAILREEYRTRVSNSAYAFGALRLRELAFQGYIPYEHAPIGSLEDLATANVEWVRRFHEDYYAPNNAVLTLSGDFDSGATLELIREYFGDAAPQTNVPSLTLPSPPRQTSERLSVVEDTNAKTPGIYYGWVIPPARTPEHYALEIAAAHLADGEASALHQLLVRTKDAAREVSASTEGHRGPDLFVVRILVAAHSSIDTAQKSFDSELRKLRVVGLTEAELTRAKEIVRSRHIMALQSSQNRALMLGDYETLWGDASLVNGELERYDAVSTKDVRQVAATILTDSRRSVVEVYPPGWIKDEYPAVLSRTHIVRKGETLIGIAAKYNVSVADILKANKMRRVGVIHPGDKLVIPRAARLPASGSAAKKGTGREAAPSAPALRSYVVKKGDTLSEVARRFGVTVSAIASLNRLGPKQRIIIGQKLVIPAKERK